VNPEDTERPINEETRSRYGVTGYPAVLFVSADGGLIKYHSGYVPPDQFVPVIEDALEKESKFQEKLEKLEAKADDAKLNAEVALTYLERKQLEKALPFSEKAFEHDPRNRSKLIPNLHNQLGLTYGNLLEGTDAEESEAYFEKAVSHFKIIIDKYPNSKVYEPAQYYLGLTYAIREHFEDAIVVLEKLSHHARDANIRQSAEAMLERVKDLANAN
jgi:tetratricopeptide (TPR) repeat protein